MIRPNIDQPIRVIPNVEVQFVTYIGPKMKIANKFISIMVKFCTIFLGHSIAFFLYKFFHTIGYIFNTYIVCSTRKSWQRVRALPEIGFSPFGKQTNPFLQVINDAFSQHSMKYFFVCKLLLFLSQNWLQHSFYSKINSHICSARILIHH